MPKASTPDIYTLRLARRLRELREATGMSQMKWAAEHDFNRTHVGFLETGERSPNIATMVRLARAHDMTVAQLVDGIDAPE